MLKYTGIDGAVVIEYSVEVRTKDRHVLGSIGCSCAIWQLHSHIHRFLVVCGFAFGE